MNIQSSLRDPRRLFWTLQIGGWAGWGLFKYSYVTLGEGGPDNYAWYVTLISFIGLVLTLGLRQVYRYVWERPLWIRVLLTLGASFAVAYAWIEMRSYIFSNWVHLEEKEFAKEEWILRMVYLGSIMSEWFVMLSWSVLYYGFKYQRIFQEVRENALKSSAMAHEAQLKMLRYQLNPHFLFNTLNAISTLILEQETEIANRMVTRLSSFLRYSLDNDPMQKISLKQELAALKLYLDIEKVRFEDRLQLEEDIQDEAQQALIPSLLLQPLVENAIKYGIAEAEDGARLRIAARVFAGDLLLELSDDGPGVALENGEIPDAKGVGLRNTRERLIELYGPQHSFRLSKTEPHGLTVNIRIPCVFE